MEDYFSSFLQANSIATTMATTSHIAFVNDKNDKGKSTIENKKKCKKVKEGALGTKLLRRTNYFVEDDIVWVKPPRLPLWPAEIVAVEKDGALFVCRMFFPPASHTTSPDIRISGAKLYYFDKLIGEKEIKNCIEWRLQRHQFDPSAYEKDFTKAVTRANTLVRIVMDACRLKPFSVCGVGVVHSLMRTHTAAPRQPATGTFEPQPAMIVLRPGLANAARDLKGFEYIWVLFHFSYSTGLGQSEIDNDRGDDKKETDDEKIKEAETEESNKRVTTSYTHHLGKLNNEIKNNKSDQNGNNKNDNNNYDDDSNDSLTNTCSNVAPESHHHEHHHHKNPYNHRTTMLTEGWKTQVIPPRDTKLRGVFSTRSPHRPNSIGLSCVRLVDVQGLIIHIADHDLLHGTPVLDIKPYLPFCDAHPDAKAGWIDQLEKSGKAGPDHRGTEGIAVHRYYEEKSKKMTRHA